ncbi:MAG: UDP-glucose/GDP-mannose dehydrogenase family protein [Nanoarchaeota archaeon]|nr:UDP-glucose/GDP-mannose dehydrogenase family protein [Nanoarchaeota archaeon]
MKISILGAGYAGLTVGTCLASLGNEVTCIDVDQSKIEKLNNLELPIYELGLLDMLKQNVEGERQFFTTDFSIVKTSDVIYIAVGTPQSEDGSADLTYIDSAAKAIGENIDSYKVVVIKSTVPVGTAYRVKRIINQVSNIAVDVVSNPEFLREGAAIKDFLNPERIVIGTDSENAKKLMTRVYKSLERTGKPIIFTDNKSAELIKYASNAFLAMKISFINEIATFCEVAGADVKAVAKGIGYDSRIGPRFLQAGLGYGGSCFPKDIRSLIKQGKNFNANFRLLESADDVNTKQRMKAIPKLRQILPDLKGKTVAVWGLAFKPKTDDIREAPSLNIVDELLKFGANVKAFDPVAKDSFRKIFPEIEFCKTPYEAAKDVHALIICTEWDTFRELDMGKVKSFMTEANLVDGRNVFDPKEMVSLGFNYSGFGRGLQ